MIRHMCFAPLTVEPPGKTSLQICRSLRSCGRRGGCMRLMMLVAAIGTLAACGGTVLTDTKKEAVSGGCSLQTPNSCGPGFVCCPPGNPPDGWDGTGFCVQGTDPRICRQIQ